jgi:hypothetical protein
VRHREREPSPADDPPRSDLGIALDSSYAPHVLLCQQLGRIRMHMRVTRSEM